ncbi:hypothetical protein CDEST_10456 [Colletotrichum destructivum]|uniref:Uncharacterized protein n=1 Tax=Colletotrichum destructivum TaxID=34406 RepID=A0AAX4IQ64_9PEZI|nr:hypothetical protein CDEST_10456 [Colletotrichum destructivum]
MPGLPTITPASSTLATVHLILGDSPCDDLDRVHSQAMGCTAANHDNAAEDLVHETTKDIDQMIQQAAQSMPPTGS